MARRICRCAQSKRPALGRLPAHPASSDRYRRCRFANVCREYSECDDGALSKDYHDKPAFRVPAHLVNLGAARACALTASSARFLGGALVSSELRKLPDIAAMSSTATRNAASLAFDGLLKPLTFLTNCNEAARISSSVTGGWKLKSVLMFLHTIVYLVVSKPPNKSAGSEHRNVPKFNLNNRDNHDNSG